MAFRFGQQAHGKGWCYFTSGGMILIGNRHFYFSEENWDNSKLSELIYKG